MQSAEGGDIPTIIEGEPLEEQVYIPWTVHTRKRKSETPIPGQMNLFSYYNLEPQPVSVLHDGNTIGEGSASVLADNPAIGVISTSHMPEDSLLPGKNEQNVKPVTPQKEPLPIITTLKATVPEEMSAVVEPQYAQLSFAHGLDREEVIRFINGQGYLNYMVRSVRINSYLKSLLSLAGLLTQYMIYQNANDEVRNEVTDLIHSYIEKLHQEGKYDDLAKKVSSANEYVFIRTEIPGKPSRR